MKPIVNSRQAAREAAWADHRETLIREEAARREAANDTQARPEK